jgi:hypothetical protein
MLQLTFAHVSPPKMPAPVLWGNEAVVRERLREGISELRMMRRLISLKFPFDVPKVVEFYHKYYGPNLRAFEVLSIEDQAVLRRDLERLWSEHNRAIDGTTYIESEHLEVVATRG